LEAHGRVGAPGMCKGTWKDFNMICPLSTSDCEYCSEENQREIRDATNLLTKRKVMIKKIIPLGLMCNNAPIKANPWIANMKQCPIQQPLTMEIRKRMYKNVHAATYRPHTGRVSTIPKQVKQKLRSPTVSKKRVGQQTLL
jgi:hypothetical protein